MQAARASREPHWDGERFVYGEVWKSWPTGRLLVRDEKIDRGRSWKDLHRNHPITINLAGLTTAFEAVLDDGTRSLQPPTPGYMSIVPAGRMFSGTFQGRSNKYAGWEVPPEILAALADEAGLRGALELAPRLSHRDEWIHAAIRRLEATDEADGNLADLAGESLCRALALHLLGRYRAGAQGLPARVKKRILTRRAVASLQTFINEHLAQKITLDQLASLAGENTHNVLLGFRQQFGKTPYQYIMDERVKRGRWLLAHTAKPISEIAYDAGFSSQSHFTTVFKRYFGTTPHAFRSA